MNRTVNQILNKNNISFCTISSSNERQNSFRVKDKVKNTKQLNCSWHCRSNIENSKTLTLKIKQQPTRAAISELRMHGMYLFRMYFWFRTQV